MNNPTAKPVGSRSAVEVVCERIQTMPEWRKRIAAKTARGDLLLAYMNDETSGFSDAAMARHLELIEACEDLLDAERAKP